MQSDATRSRSIAAHVTVNSAESSFSACIAGLGLIQIPVYDVQDELAVGTLIEVPANYRAQSMPMALLYTHRHQFSRRLQVFTDWLIDLLRQRVVDPEPPTPSARWPTIEGRLQQ